MPHRMKTDNRQIAMQMRKEGITLQSIADTLGVSRQRVAQYLAGVRQENNKRKWTVSKAKCKYTGLRNWLNSRFLPMSSLIVGIGYEYCPSTADSFRYKLAGDGYTLNIRDIKAILAFTNMTFEECFGEVDEEK